jgi:endonuclease/exonuclease/phosphatase family metal-dependent hydrolase
MTPDRVRRVAAAVASLACCAGLLTGSTASSQALRAPLRVLQMNLCDSGYAPCYSGRSVAAAVAVFREVSPDLVTLNEVCRDDVAALRRVLAGVYQDGVIVSGFQAAGDRDSGGQFRCLNGQPYGIGVVARVPAPYRGFSTDGAVYPAHAQDGADPEQRAWLCLHATDHFALCTTHLTDTIPAVALAQCQYLLRTAVPTVLARRGHRPVVLAGDLNLRLGGTPDLRSCLPAGYQQVDDGDPRHLATQDLLATAGSRVRSRRLVDLHGASDHPSLLVTLSLP